MKITASTPAFPKSSWHPWFAWRPVRVADRTWVWLEKIERRVLYLGDYDPVDVREYRMPQA